MVSARRNARPCLPRGLCDSKAMPTGSTGTIQIAEEYAQREPGTRRELFSRLQQFATKQHDATLGDGSNASEYVGGFLHEIE